MNAIPAASCTDTLLVVHDHVRFIADRPAWEATKAWCERHGIDACEVLARGPIHRDVDHCRVVYVGRVGRGVPRDHDAPDHFEDFPPGWSTVYRQGETPPMPWPPELDRYRRDELVRNLEEPPA